MALVQLILLANELQAVAFLNAMAHDIEFAEVESPFVQTRPHGGLETPFEFSSMRRKAFLPHLEQ